MAYRSPAAAKIHSKQVEVLNKLYKKFSSHLRSDNGHQTAAVPFTLASLLGEEGISELKTRLEFVQPH